MDQAIFEPTAADEPAVAKASRGMPLSRAVAYCAGAVTQGASVEGLFAASLIEPSHGDDRDEISAAQFDLLSMNIVCSIEDASHGLGATRFPSAYCAAGLRAALGCATLDGALRALIGIYELASSSIRLNLRVEGELACLMVRCDGRTPAEAYSLEDAYLAFMFMHCSQFLGRPCPLVDLVTRDADHFNLDQAHFLVKAVVRHGPVSALRFPRSLLAARRGGRVTDAVYSECLRQWLQFVEGVGAVAPDLGSDPGNWTQSLGDLANQAGVSLSTMRRRLEANHGGFRGARQHAIANAGIVLLRSSDFSVETVAAELGYADARSFRRFLKGATGKTPEQIRVSDPDLAGYGAQNRVHRRILEVAGSFDSY